jgi:transcriptional regulator with XRE-family HTH domain
MTRRISEIDAHVGVRVRRLREIRGLSRETIARAFEITHQQIQKFESGQNRISAGRLAVIAQMLDVPIAYFYEGLPEPGLPEQVRAAGASVPAGFPADLTAECFALLKLFVHVRNPLARHSVIELVNALAEDDSPARAPKPVAHAPILTGRQL